MLSRPLQDCSIWRPIIPVLNSGRQNRPLSFTSIHVLLKRRGLYSHGGENCFSLRQPRWENNGGTPVVRMRSFQHPRTYVRRRVRIYICSYYPSLKIGIKEEAAMSSLAAAFLIVVRCWEDERVNCFILWWYGCALLAVPTYGIAAKRSRGNDLSPRGWKGSTAAVSWRRCRSLEGDMLPIRDNGWPI